MRGVAAARGEVGKERLARILPADRVQPLNRLVRHRVGQVVGVLLVVELRGRPDDLLVLGQARVPLPRAPTQEPVEVLEPPADRPAIKRARRALLAVRRQVPFAERRRGVAVVAQDPRERHAVIRHERRIAGEPGRELPDRTEPDRMAIATGEQRRPRRRAERRHVEAVVPHALLRHARVVGCIDRAAEGSGISEPGIVDQHHQHVRRAVGRIDVPQRRPVRLRALKRPVRHAPDRSACGSAVCFDQAGSSTGLRTGCGGASRSSQARWKLPAVRRRRHHPMWAISNRLGRLAVTLPAWLSSRYRS